AGACCPGRNGLTTSTSGPGSRLCQMLAEDALMPHNSVNSSAGCRPLALADWYRRSVTVVRRGLGGAVTPPTPLVGVPRRDATPPGRRGGACPAAPPRGGGGPGAPAPRSPGSSPGGGRPPPG